MSIRCKEIEVDFPTIGKYYGEKIPVIFSIDPGDTPDYQIKRDVFVDRFVELKPYKELYHAENITHIHSQHIVSHDDLISEMKLMAAQAESVLNLRDGSKILAVIWAPYWRQGAEIATIQKIGKYIYAYAVIKSAGDDSHFPNGQVKHEINHLFGLTGDNGFPESSGNQTALANETSSDYIYANPMNPKWMAEDEMRMITHLRFDNGVAYGTYPFGCRSGQVLYWYHNYANTATPHREYSATWQEVKPFIEKISKGELVNKNPCQS